MGRVRLKSWCFDLACSMNQGSWIRDGLRMFAQVKVRPHSGQVPFVGHCVFQVAISPDWS